MLSAVFPSFLLYALYRQRRGSELPCNPESNDLYVWLQEAARIDEAAQWLQDTYGDKLTVFRAGAKLLNIHAPGVSKIRSARRLQETLGRKILVCVGDAENDLPMLEGADYAYCPADGTVADRFETVCPCGDGAVADVIYEKIPAILKG